MAAAVPAVITLALVVVRTSGTVVAAGHATTTAGKRKCGVKCQSESVALTICLPPRAAAVQCKAEQTDQASVSTYPEQ